MIFSSQGFLLGYLGGCELLYICEWANAIVPLCQLEDTWPLRGSGPVRKDVCALFAQGYTHLTYGQQAWSIVDSMPYDTRRAGRTGRRDALIGAASPGMGRHPECRELEKPQSEIASLSRLGVGALYVPP